MSMHRTAPQEDYDRLKGHKPLTFSMFACFPISSYRAEFVQKKTNNIYRFRSLTMISILEFILKDTIHLPWVIRNALVNLFESH